MVPCKLIAYRRVSTHQQGRSGLGLEAQEATIATYAKSSGCTVVASYTEVESGKRNDRPELARALAHCRRLKAKLVIAKLDRLSRDAAFLMTLQAGCVPFICCDMPEADETMIGIMAVFAQRERKMISIRTKDALAAAKARGVLLGVARPGAARLDAGHARMGNARSAEVRSAASAEKSAEARARAAELRADGMSQSRIAETLNAEGLTTTNTGKPWTQATVSRLLAREAVYA